VVKWRRFTPADFEYDFERDELATHYVTFDEAIECFFLTLRFDEINLIEIAIS
jgi:hypothetical protein